MFLKVRNIAFVVFICFVLFYFFYEKNNGGASVDDLREDVPESWQKLSNKRIFFGHQSVGYNIIDGIRQLLDENPQIQLEILEKKEVLNILPGQLRHFKIGTNEDPESKTKDFAKILEPANQKGVVDVAFHKYCYIDFNKDTDIEKVFSNYKKQMDWMKSKYQHVRFVHFTVPLTAIQRGPKAWVKKILGKPVGGMATNIKRNQFNLKLLEAYDGIDPIFDLARVQSTRPDGSLVYFTEKNKRYLSLYDGYSDDGGHLNKRGQKNVASRLLTFLAGVE
ncbi:hypothetical protein SAMN02746065_10389 [Desulfocicer vacuolatum DSM 3385]|uniref:SGNH/GDSL hydrolase family protein n=1 Tax=Desulfocicer vacuolatum DSM 3385 TaxID=1121400 RepID=A0A1W1ZPR3_9BACT|nr:hypothetical protein [Desulfocicer vacuolatum]SMC50386.1 hypothetical protein SAMN02746065_10389 [Desulfocicer vacuolatum DSM 3385]